MTRHSAATAPPGSASALSSASASSILPQGSIEVLHAGFKTLFVERLPYSYFGNTGDRRLREIRHQTGSGTTLSDFQYAYDGVGNITTWTQQYGTDVKAYDFSYDAADQLTGASIALRTRRGRS